MLGPCPQCGEQFRGRPDKRFCSDRCRWQHWCAARDRRLAEDRAAARAPVPRAPVSRAGFDQAVQALLEAQALLDTARTALLHSVHAQVVGIRAPGTPDTRGRSKSSDGQAPD
jgi:hypothetical protein